MRNFEESLFDLNSYYNRMPPELSRKFRIRSKSSEDQQTIINLALKGRENYPNGRWRLSFNQGNFEKLQPFDPNSEYFSERLVLSRKPERMLDNFPARLDFAFEWEKDNWERAKDSVATWLSNSKEDILYRWEYSNFRYQFMGGFIGTIGVSLVTYLVIQCFAKSYYAYDREGRFLSELIKMIWNK